MKPQPPYNPISEGMIGLATGGYTRAVTEVYFPACFADFTCLVSQFEIDICSFRRTIIRTTFTLSGPPKMFLEPYMDEVWKTQATTNFFRFIETTPDCSDPIAPVFALMLSEPLVVSSVALKIDGTDSEAYFDQSPDILVAPSSYPPLLPIPDGEGYRYYEQKSTVIYTKLLPDKEYAFVISLDCYGATDFAPLFPYGHTVFNKAKLDVRSSGQLLIKHSFCFTLHREAVTEWPAWLDNKLQDKDKAMRRPPQMKRALPRRGQMPAFDIKNEFRDEIKDIADSDIDGIMDAVLKHSYDYAELSNKSFREFETFRPMNTIIIPPDMDFDISVQTIQKPLATRIYDQLHNLPGYKDVLIEYDIMNLSKYEQELIVETEIAGITDPMIETVRVPGLGTKNKSARDIVSQCPRLKFGILEQINTPYKATLVAKVTNKENGKILLKETRHVDLLPNDQMIWQLNDVRNSHSYDLHKFIASWVTPVDANGLMDQIRAKAAVLHPDKSFGDAIGSLGDIRDHVKAIYDYLVSLGFCYVSQPFSSSHPQDSQRVVLPERVIANRSGNCIDLSVLFASLLEGVGINTLIFITKEHAFIGWGNPAITKEMFFLETTVIGTADFDMSTTVGEQNFRKHFLLIGQENPSYPALMALYGCHVIDLHEVRKQGIVARK